MTAPIRARFAPSPTGMPHIGGVRTALFNWLFARRYGGKFLLRIEDTDVARTVEGSVEAIFQGLQWMGLNWDEGPDIGGPFSPYYQSQRLSLYQEAAKKLVEQGDAYYCYCSSQRLEEMRKEQQAKKLPPGYDRCCRDLTPEERQKKEAECTAKVVRFKMPLTGQTKFNDLIRKEVVFENSTLDDHVLLKSDGFPTYHLANVVDDHLMEITHVIRGEEWLSSTPRHLLLYQALGYQPPEFAHLPLILGPDRSKLSKRHGAASVKEYAEQGYLPDTLFNFMSLTGWSLDDKTELMSREEIIKNFSLERISPTAAIFNIEKLKWMNGVYIRKLTPNQFYEASQAFLMADKAIAGAVITDESYVRSTLPLVQDRARTLADVPELIRFFFVEELEYETKLLVEKDMTAEIALKALEAGYAGIKDLKPFDAENLEKVLRPLAAELGMKTGHLFGALRTATTGRIAAPPLFQTMAVLGKERSLKRIEAAINKLKSLSI
ncbi:MAG: glutamate--tRNA ligase [Dehalococcoidales bacterium]|nr:glutamate--tRNA ligase [Dehalococcoidales bacterium]